jgi:hypothetical protein
MQIAQPARTPFCQQYTFAVAIEVCQYLAGLQVADYRADWHMQGHIFAAFTIAIGTMPLLSLARAKDARIAKVD